MSSPEQPEAFPGRARRPAGASAGCEGALTAAGRRDHEQGDFERLPEPAGEGEDPEALAHVLHSLAAVYAVPYEALMEKAGYLLPSEDGGGRRRRLAAFAIDDLTAEEEEELLKYLAFLRFRTPS